MLVLVGEALAGIGLRRRPVSLSVPASELQAAETPCCWRSAQLTGTTERGLRQRPMAVGSSWRCASAGLLEASGHADLRAYLDENMLGTAHGRAHRSRRERKARGYRALGGDRASAIAALTRLLQLIDDRVSRSRHPVTTFSRRSICSPTGSGRARGYRLLSSRAPPIAFYGLCGVGEPDAANTTVDQLVVQRGRLARSARLLSRVRLRRRSGSTARPCSTSSSTTPTGRSTSTHLAAPPMATASRSGGRRHTALLIQSSCCSPTAWLPPASYRRQRLTHSALTGGWQSTSLRKRRGHFASGLAILRDLCRCDLPVESGRCREADR